MLLNGKGKENRAASYNTGNNIEISVFFGLRPHWPPSLTIT